MEEFFGWCIVGCGHIARKVVTQLSGTKHKVVSAYNRNFEKAKKFVEDFGGTAYPTLEEAILAKDVSCVYIATANDSHGDLTQKCISLGVPVLCEKPFALSLNEAQEVIDLAREKKVYVAEAMWTWHDTLPLRIKEIVKSGLIGDIKNGKIKFSFPMLKPGDTTSRLVNPALGGGALLDIGIYPIRHAYELFGMPKSIDAKAKIYNGVDVDDKITLDYGDFKIETICSFTTLRGESMVLNGTKGKINNPFFHMSVNAKVNGSHKERIEGNGMLYAYVEEFDHTAQDILDNKLESEYIPHKATLDTMKLLDEARRQMNVIYPQDLQ